MPFTIDGHDRTTRQINQQLREAVAAGQTDLLVRSPDARHNLAVAVLRPVRIVFDGSVGYYCGGLGDGATIEIRGNAGWGTAESMMGGTVVIDGNAGCGVAAALRGGTVVVKGQAAARAGVSMKGGTLLIGGDCGPMAGFLMQKGRIVICGDAGEAVADSMYEGVVYVAGEIAAAGNDTVIGEPDETERAELAALLREHGLPPREGFRKIVSGRKLWNFDRKELAAWRAAL